MKITYLYHSCFIVELEQHILLFDYYKGTLPNFDSTKALYVFVSHAHEDHYQPAIFHIKHPTITYVLSDDIQVHNAFCIYAMGPHKKLSLKGLQVETLASSDLGVAFLIKVEGMQIYHAGDLNWWDWGVEDTLEERRQMETFYKEEIQRIHEPIDIAFVPVDPRLHDAYCKGLSYFMEHTNTSVVFPMHFADDIRINDRLQDDMKAVSYGGKIVKISHANEEFCIIV